jgi:hypothetical protein
MSDVFIFLGNAAAIPCLWLVLLYINDLLVAGFWSCLMVNAEEIFRWSPSGVLSSMGKQAGRNSSARGRSTDLSVLQILEWSCMLW